MAILRASSLVTDLERDPLDGSRLWMTLTVIVHGDRLGDLLEPRYGIRLENVNPDSVTLAADISARIKTDMESHGIVFDVGDTVRFGFEPTRT